MILKYCKEQQVGVSKMIDSYHRALVHAPQHQKTHPLLPLSSNVNLWVRWKIHPIMRMFFCQS